MVGIYFTNSIYSVRLMLVLKSVFPHEHIIVYVILTHVVTLTYTNVAQVIPEIFFFGLM